MPRCVLHRSGDPPGAIPQRAGLRASLGQFARRSPTIRLSQMIDPPIWEAVKSTCVTPVLIEWPTRGGSRLLSRRRIDPVWESSLGPVVGERRLRKMSDIDVLDARY